MIARRLFQSPYFVVMLVAGGALAWGTTGGSLPGPERAAADEEQPSPSQASPEDAERNAQQGMALQTTTESVVRLGPELLAEPDAERLGFDIGIEDRDGRSMAALHQALRRAEAGEGQARLAFYGASHVASDLFTGYLREQLQARFGDAGHGMVMMAHPWRTYRHFGIELESSRRLWSMTKVRANRREPEHFGVNGVFVETDRANAWGRLRTLRRGEVGRSASLFDLYYMNQPGGGSFDVLVDGRPAERVSTQAAERSAGYATFRVPDGEHTFEVRTAGDGRVRLFGAAVERDAPGVIVDTLGINGARARYHLLWDDALYREHLQRRRPDLVVLAYGTNESGDSSSMERYEGEVRQVVRRVRETVPNASCLLIGPSDRPFRRGEEGYLDRPRTADLVEVQHRVAVEEGCGFFDLVSYMGGPLSMVQWVANEPPYGAPDHVHYTRRGYRRLGEVLHRALLRGYDE